MNQKLARYIRVFCSVLGIASATPAIADIVTLDFDSAGTGSNLLSSPLVTALGTITASSTNSNLLILSNPGPTGLTGDFLYHGQTVDSDYGQLAFDFDVSSVSFLWTGYGGGVFTAQALDAGLNVLASFFDDDTTELPGGPTTLSASGIRYLRFGDFPGGQGQAGIDNVVITATVPEPTTLALVGLSLAGLACVRPRKR